MIKQNKQIKKQTKQLEHMKKQTSKLGLKTEKIVLLSKEQGQSLLGGKPPEYSDTITTGKSRCWCRD